MTACVKVENFVGKVYLKYYVLTQTQTERETFFLLLKRGKKLETIIITGSIIKFNECRHWF